MAAFLEDARRPQTASGLVIKQSGPNQFVCERPGSHRSIVIAREDLEVIRLLNGRNTVSQVQQILASRGAPLAPAAIAEIVERMASLGVVTGAAPARAAIAAVRATEVDADDHTMPVDDLLQRAAEAGVLDAPAASAASAASDDDDPEDQPTRPGLGLASMLPPELFTAPLPQTPPPHRASSAAIPVPRPSAPPAAPRSPSGRAPAAAS